MRDSNAVPAVLVDVPPELASTREAAALVQACSRGLQRGECVLRAYRHGRRIDAVAIVRWSEPAQSSARIEVGARRGPFMVWQSRDLAFQDQDAALERWRSVGFVIATMASALIRADKTGVAPAPARAPERVSPASTSVALGGALAWAADPSGTRWGGWIAAARQPRSWFRIEISGQYTSLRASDQLSLRWIGITLGAGPVLELGDAGALRPKLALRGEWLLARATEAGQTASDSRFLPGLAAEVGWAWPIAGPVAALVAVEAAHLSGATAIVSEGRRIGRIAAGYSTVRAGLEARF